MCRNIKTLHNFAPPATEEEIHASALQFVRKLSGFARPSKSNEAAFDRAVEEVSAGRTRIARLAREQRAAARPRGGGREGQSPRRHTFWYGPTLALWRCSQERGKGASIAPMVVSTPRQAR